MGVVWQRRRREAIEVDARPGQHAHLTLTNQLPFDEEMAVLLVLEEHCGSPTEADTGKPCYDLLEWTILHERRAEPTDIRNRRDAERCGGKGAVDVRFDRVTGVGRRLEPAEQASIPAEEIEVGERVQSGAVEFARRLAPARGCRR